jgi:hypothetical protein
MVAGERPGDITPDVVDLLGGVQMSSATGWRTTTAAFFDVNTMSTAPEPNRSLVSPKAVYRPDPQLGGSFGSRISAGAIAWRR